jgi:hypothetical protein
MVIHIVNGDALAEKFPLGEIGGGLVIFRECLVEGPLGGDTLRDFWQVRSSFIEERYGESAEGYDHKVVSELDKLKVLPAGTEVNLWFEHDLFCQVNMWFAIALLEEGGEELLVIRVMPENEQKEVWRGFGSADARLLLAAYSNRKPLSGKDRQLATFLWQAYRHNQTDILQRLAADGAEGFPYLEEVVQAHIQRLPDEGYKGRPAAILEDILRDGDKDFSTIFHEFGQREGIYGFGEAQVRNLLAEMKMGG